MSRTLALLQKYRPLVISHMPRNFLTDRAGRVGRKEDNKIRIPFYAGNRARRECTGRTCGSREPLHESIIIENRH